MKRFTRRFAALAAASVTALAVLCSCGKTYTVSKENDIVDFLTKNGICTAGSGARKEIVIPEEFGDVYENYNELQKAQGFDLHSYSSREAEVYTYDVVSVGGEHRENTEAHIIVCDGKIIGCDISSPAIGGEMEAVIK